jgi:hypothetical protein
VYQRFHYYVSRFNYITNLSNPIADVLDLFSQFLFHLLQKRGFQLWTPQSALISAAISVLLWKNQCLQNGVSHGRKQLTGELTPGFCLCDRSLRISSEDTKRTRERLTSTHITHTHVQSISLLCQNGFDQDETAVGPSGASLFP